MSARGDRSSGPGLPLPVFCASIALALILDGLHLGPSKIGGISTGRATSEIDLSCRYPDITKFGPEL